MGKKFIGFSEGIEFVFKILSINWVKVNFDVFLSIADSGVLSDDLGWGDDVVEESVVD